jgi:DNA-binding IclR family transcriptional regulator
LAKATSYRDAVLPPDRKQRAGVRVIDRAIDILSCFTEANANLSLRDISDRTGIHKATAFRILSTLVDAKILDQPTPGAPYELGFFALQCADAILCSNELRRRALPIMLRLRDALNETVVLALRHENSVLNIDKVMSRQGIIETPTIGVYAPLHESAAGLAILSTFDDDDLARYMKAECLDPTSPEARMIRERADKSRSLLANPAKATAQMPVVAAPISVGGRAIAALSIAIPAGRADRDLVQRCLKKLIRAAQQLASTSP